MNNGDPKWHDEMDAGHDAFERAQHRAQTLLCARCRSGHIFYRRHVAEPIVHCSWIDQHSVPGDIVWCNKFDDAALPSLYNMKQIATPIPDPSVRAGFEVAKPSRFDEVKGDGTD